MPKRITGLDHGGSAPARCEGGIMGQDYSALFYVLLAVILVAKFYVGSCGCG
jgi:hypothetical protein